jgi:hypothetical protein
MTRLQNGVILGAAIATSVIGVIEYFNFTGFCYSQRRWLGNQELINAAIKYELSHVRGPYALGALSYSSLDEFKELNPQCCDLDRSGNNPALDGKWVRSLGIYNAAIHLHYRFRQTGQQQFWFETLFVNACGRFLDRGGFPTDIPPPTSKL